MSNSDFRVVEFEWLGGRVKDAGLARERNVLADLGVALLEIVRRDDTAFGIKQGAWVGECFVCT